MVYILLSSKLLSQKYYMNKFLDYKKEFFLSIILYLSLYLGFFLENREVMENLDDYFYGMFIQRIGPYSDFLMREPIIENFSNNFLDTFLNYDKTPDRHSPVLLIYISLFRKLGLEIDTIRLLHINILPLCVWAFFMCLKVRFPEIKKSLLIILSLSLFLSPPIRALSIWPDSRIYGLLIFIISIYFFIQFNNHKRFKYALYNTLFLCLASYLSPNFGVFFIYYFYHFFKHYKTSIKTFIILCANFICALPAYYYLFELKIFFLSTEAISGVDTSIRLNPSNKILIISSIILFYFIPFLFNKDLVNDFYKRSKDFKKILLSIIFTSILILFFSYEKNFTGGGIFFQFSNLIFKNNLIFFLICFLSISLLIYLWNISPNNRLILICLFISNPQLTIYHKYYDPLLIILFFLLFDFKINIKRILNTSFLKFLYIFFSSFLILNYLKNI